MSDYILIFCTVKTAMEDCVICKITFAEACEKAHSVMWQSLSCLGHKLCSLLV